MRGQVKDERLENLRELRRGLVDRQLRHPEIAGQIEILIRKTHEEIWKILEKTKC